MVVKIGGSIGYKLTAKPYESVDINAFISIEKDLEKVTDEDIELMNEDINKKLESQLIKRMEKAIELYKDKMLKIRGNV